MLEEHLAQAERHVREGEEHLVKQHAIVAQLERDGLDAHDARELLGQFKQMQGLHVADRDRLRKELGL